VVSKNAKILFTQWNGMNSSTEASAGPEEKGRRTFFGQAIGILTAALTVALGGSLAAVSIGPMFRKTKPYFSPVTGFDIAPEGQPVELRFSYSETDAYLRKDVTETVWVIKHSPTSATVFSPICPHLGCRFDWIPGAKRFACPCHQSVFSPDGTVLGGPSPRPLDSLQYKIEGATLSVQWERFDPGVSRKVRIG
jgi:menaquinol-cytochrome c reductase iron-sulfur subunit